MGTIRAVNAALDGMRFTPAADFVGSAGIQITTNDLGQARPGGAKSDTDTVSIVVQPPAVTDLGPLDFLEMPGQDPSVGTLAYSLATTHEALVTIEASFTGGPDDVQLKLYDANPFNDAALQPLAVSALVDGKQRIDYPADSAGQAYYFTISGRSTSADLLLVNLVQQQGSAVTVHGTVDDDTFGFDASASRAVTINGVRYEFEDAEARSVTFDGGAGMDVVIMDDSAGDEVLTAGPTHAVFSNGDPTTGFTVTVDGFETMHVYARSGGMDRAYFYDSNKNDKFKSEPAKNYAKMYGGQMYNRVKFFDTVGAYSSGQNDLARLFDTAANDTFLGQKDFSRMTTADANVMDVVVHNFRRVIAYANQGGVDEATLVDSALKDEFHGKSHKSTIFDADTDGSVYEITARRFDHVRADGSQGDEYDKAKLWGTPDDDRVEAAADLARFWSQGTTPRLLYEVAAFEFVKIRASTGGNDTSDVTDPLAFLLAFEDGWDQ